MTKIPASLREHIDSAFPANVILVGSVQPNGYAQITPRGSTQVYDDEHISLWERGRGSTNAAITDGTKLTFFLLPQAATARERRAAEWRRRPLLRHGHGP